ncbi:MAG: outer membrane protein assembly factor, partial [Saprospiraceae bacterium]
MLRELEFAQGDSLQDENLPFILSRNQLRLMNTGLFTSADIQPDSVLTTPGHLHLKIIIVETWYIYPVPLFELADRNFNVWWREFHHSLRRVNYGLDLSYLNLTGHADALKVKGQFGYNNKYELSYR